MKLMIASLLWSSVFGFVNVQTPSNTDGIPLHSSTDYSKLTEVEEVKYAQAVGKEYHWMIQAGIPSNQWDKYYELVHRESSWNPHAVNPSSGACGLAQALPCSKIPGQWNDPVNSLKWMRQYVENRYGTVGKAIQFHNQNNWY